MSSTAAIPGLHYKIVRPPAEPAPLRTDIAGFMGSTLRGPVGVAVRVEGWREAASEFGTLTPGAFMPYALRGYFDNEGEVAHVVRILGEGSQTALGTWTIGTFDPNTGKLDADWPGAAGFQNLQFQLEASSPGDWANNMVVSFRYWSKGPSAAPELEVEVVTSTEGVELLSKIAPEAVADMVNAQSTYLRMTPLDLPAGLLPANLLPPNAPLGPRYFEWGPIYLSGGTLVPPTRKAYLSAVQELGDEPEVAFTSCPDLHASKLSEEDCNDILYTLLSQAEELHDRLVLLDVPPAYAEPTAARDWVKNTFRDRLTEKTLRNGAVYHPRLMVPDPLGRTPASLRCVPCCGLVAGMISRLDRQFGPYYTPANAEIEKAVDLSRPLDAKEQAILYTGGINLLKCFPQRGLLVWGGRVLSQDPVGTPLAHRRLIHVLSRSIRRIAEPLVFDNNGPELWLAFTRSITSVLLEAYRAGALKGDRPEQAFQVTCDSTTNPPEQIENGTVICEIQVAPAYPMEFIQLRVAVSGEGKLEVFES